MASKTRCVFGCDVLGAYMHRFPHPEKRKELFALWLATVGDRMVEKDPLKIYNSKRVCDYHFKPGQKVTGHRLINLAVPTLHLQGVVKNIAIATQMEHNYSLPRMNMDVDVNPTPQTDEALQIIKSGRLFTLDFK
ncbi:hypothetical protein PYW08_010527 [Mythimna loreyi]|uniref:Uncharacterized protein n=1 Tax=Mythimna loreyi TaxID=667449 RepID=A0ACC2Q6N9_9NEOP|nr:hypothetical protein PYW08_010527 [Mythimna loreyi]